MARISLIEAAQASAEVKEIYDSKLKGKPGNIQKALAQGLCFTVKQLDKNGSDNLSIGDR